MVFGGVVSFASVAYIALIAEDTLEHALSSIVMNKMRSTCLSFRSPDKRCVLIGFQLSSFLSLFNTQFTLKNVQRSEIDWRSIGDRFDNHTQIRIAIRVKVGSLSIQWIGWECFFVFVFLFCVHLLRKKRGLLFFLDLLKRVHLCFQAFVCRNVRFSNRNLLA